LIFGLFRVVLDGAFVVLEKEVAELFEFVRKGRTTLVDFALGERVFDVDFEMKRSGFTNRPARPAMRGRAKRDEKGTGQFSWIGATDTFNDAMNADTMLKVSHSQGAGSENIGRAFPG
jgi:hypothetical protein